MHLDFDASPPLSGITVKHFSIVSFLELADVMSQIRPSTFPFDPLPATFLKFAFSQLAGVYLP